MATDPTDQSARHVALAMRALAGLAEDFPDDEIRAEAEALLLRFLARFREVEGDESIPLELRKKITKALKGFYHA